MTVISSGSIALTLLKQTQTSTLSSGARKSATDTIIDIVSTQTKAKAAAKPPRETGGTVSSELSSAQLSGMTAAGRFSVNQTSSSLGFGGYAATLGEASGMTTVLVDMVGKYNSQFHPTTIPTREEWNTQVLNERDFRIAHATARGASVDMIYQVANEKLTDEGYQKAVKSIQYENDFNFRYAQYATESIGYISGHLQSTFGIQPKISLDENGEATLAAFEIKYANGQTMLSYSEDRTIKTYNEDGSLRK